jgi:hypothetical protein
MTDTSPTRSPDIKADEKIAAAHFIDLKVSRLSPAVSPCDKDDCPTEATNDGIEQFYLPASRITIHEYPLAGGIHQSPRGVDFKSIF